MDIECLEAQLKTMQCQRRLEAANESERAKKSGGASDVLPSDSASLHPTPPPSVPTAGSERRMSGGHSASMRLTGTAAMKLGGAAAAVAVVTKVGEVGWVGVGWVVEEFS